MVDYVAFEPREIRFEQPNEQEAASSLMAPVGYFLDDQSTAKRAIALL
jgi:hypothetical protein